jgi:flagellar biosynthesis/type III secretory pathway protein FliH
LTIDLTIPLKEKAFRMGIEQGIEQGIGQGIEKGMEKGTFSVLVKLLERRLGALSPELLGQLEKAGLPALNRLVDVAMDLESLEEVEVFLKGQV